MPVVPGDRINGGMINVRWDVEGTLTWEIVARGEGI
jgi:hypothetical protein